MDGIYYIGIDSGSTSTELVALDSNLQVVKAVMVRTGANAAAGGRKALEQAGIQPQQIIRSVATGYGRKNMDFVDENVTEITCHAKGAVHLYPQVRTIIDIGGQDSKVIRLSEDGKVVGFVMNDKCAAGTGRFLENMAKVLELTMDQMATVGLNYQEDLTISNMCTVFAESEVVSLIAENHSVSDIVHGLNKSVASKTRALATSAKEGGPFMMTGGVANNLGVVSELEKQLNASVYIPDRPEFCGALGAALIAAEQAH
jgi:predicted CoA-substrate-specific enzyme activase